MLKKETLIDNELRSIMNGLKSSTELVNRVRDLYRNRRMSSFIDFYYNKPKPFDFGHRPINADDIYFYVYGSYFYPPYREALTKQLVEGNMLPLPKEFEDFRHFAYKGGYIASRQTTLDVFDEDICDECLEYGIKTVFSETLPKDLEAKYEFYQADKICFLKKGDKSIIRINDHITIENIPDRAYKYRINGMSAIEYKMKHLTPKWLNNKARKEEEPIFPLGYMLSIIKTALETMKYIDEIPTKVKNLPEVSLNLIP